jgi:hypothetical protein
VLSAAAPDALLDDLTGFFEVVPLF